MASIWWMGIQDTGGMLWLNKYEMGKTKKGTREAEDASAPISNDPVSHWKTRGMVLLLIILIILQKTARSGACSSSSGNAARQILPFPLLLKSPTTWSLAAFVATQTRIECSLRNAAAAAARQVTGRGAIVLPPNWSLSLALFPERREKKRL